MRKGLRVLSLMALTLVAVTAVVRFSLSGHVGNAGGRGWAKFDASGKCSNLPEIGDRNHPACGGDHLPSH